MDNKGYVYFDTQLAGTITETDNGYTFSYHPQYLSTIGAKPISVNFPLSPYPFHSQALFGFFDGLIPEGWLLNIAVDHWKVKINDRFQLLLHSCRDTIGAVTVVPSDDNALNNTE